MHAGDRNGGNGADTLRDEPLERENRFKELMQMFDRLDQIVYRYRNGLQKKRMPSF